MNAIDLLKTHHKEVKEMLEKVVESSGNEGMKLLQEITQNLLAHMVIEQEIFYPAAAEAKLMAVDEGYEEHVVARVMMIRGMQSKGDKTLFQARCKVLKELIEHHVEEEEEEMFPSVQKALGEEKLDALGAKMEPRFEELKGMSLPALSRRAEEVEVLSEAKTGGSTRKPIATKRKPAARAKKKTVARATRKLAAKRKRA